MADQSLPPEPPYRLYGLVMVLVISGLIALSILAFNDTFSAVVPVRVQISAAGLQLLPGSDVKLRGLIVGEVKSITSTGDGATLHLDLNPADVRLIPDNVSAQILPKTLFGEEYVDLIPPSVPAGSPLRAGDVIPEDRSTPALEIDKALNDLLPLLQTVQPAQVDQTLTALATALNGRGNELGQVLVQLGDYLHQLNPRLPQLRTDWAELAHVADTYTQAAPDLLRLLSNATVTGATIVAEQTQLSQLLPDLTVSANTTRDLLSREAGDLVTVNAVARPVLDLLARYSPEFPCFFAGYDKLIPRIHAAVPTAPGLNHSAHVVVEFLPPSPSYQYPTDLPDFTDTRGPHCYGLPNPPMELPRIRFKDGTQNDPRYVNNGAAPGAAPATHGPADGPALDRAVLSTLLAPLLSLPSTSVPDVADLLWGPVLRGTQVSLR